MLGSAKSEDPRLIIREIIVKVVQSISQYLNVTDRPWTGVQTTFIPWQYRAVHTASRGKNSVTQREISRLLDMTS